MTKITSFMHHVTAEGDRISYTYSVIDDTGKITQQNVRENFIVTDNTILEHISAINAYIEQRMD